MLTQYLVNYSKNNFSPLKITVMENNEDKTRKGEREENANQVPPDQKPKPVRSAMQMRVFQKMGMVIKVSKDS